MIIKAISLRNQFSRTIESGVHAQKFSDAPCAIVPRKVVQCANGAVRLGSSCTSIFVSHPASQYFQRAVQSRRLGTGDMSSSAAESTSKPNSRLGFDARREGAVGEKVRNKAIDVTGHEASVP